MDTMTMDLKKIQLAQYILGLSDFSMLDKICQLISTENPGYAVTPCHYTYNQVCERLRVCEEEALAGLGIPQDEIEQESLNWI